MKTPRRKRKKLKRKYWADKCLCGLGGVQFYKVYLLKYEDGTWAKKTCIICNTKKNYVRVLVTEL